MFDGPDGRTGDPTDQLDIPRAARAWANACTGITVISVTPVGADDRYHGAVRYDQPGQMGPQYTATLMFAPAELGRHEYDQIGQLRRKAKRVLVVADDPAIETPAPRTPSWLTRLRRHRRIDGVWARVLDDGTLELRDPNDGQSPDPEDKTRYQFRVDGGALFRRRLPPASVGDAWRDVGVPEWEPGTTPPADELLYAYWAVTIAAGQ